MSLSLNWVKSCVSCIEREKSKSLFVRSLFLRSLSQNIAVMTPMVTLSTPKWVKKVQINIPCAFVDRKMKIKSKRYFEVNYSFMKSFSQHFQILTQRGEVINAKLAC